MLEASVGDDVRGEDPTVNKLQNIVAEMTGFESSLFVCSGVMSNQIAVRTHVTELSSTKDVPFISVICDSRSHMFDHELGGIAFHSNSQCIPINPLHFNSPFLTADIIRKYINLSNDLHSCVSYLVLLENTLGGDILPLSEIIKIKELCDEFGLQLHLDGARLWNACIANNLTLKDYSQYTHSLSLCFSKGLGAPIGSILCGNTKFINKSKIYRKSFGGGWRQSGYLAAAALYAINNNWKRMIVDHQNAFYFYENALKIGFTTASVPQTNMVWLNCSNFNTNWQSIIKNINKIQDENKTEKSERIYLEGEGLICRIVFHLQIPKLGADKLLGLLKQSVNQI